MSKPHPRGVPFLTTQQLIEWFLSTSNRPTPSTAYKLMCATMSPRFVNLVRSHTDTFRTLPDLNTFTPHIPYVYRSLLTAYAQLLLYRDPRQRKRERWSELRTQSKRTKRLNNWNTIKAQYKRNSNLSTDGLTSNAVHDIP